MLGVIQYSILTIFWLPIAAAALYGAGLAIYRLFLSPLAKFPGPKLAALTRKYESYYEAYQNYEYLWKIKELHKQYGEPFTPLATSFTPWAATGFDDEPLKRSKSKIYRRNAVAAMPNCLKIDCGSFALHVLAFCEENPDSFSKYRSHRSYQSTRAPYR